MKPKKFIFILAAMIFVFGLGLVAYRIISGRSLGLSEIAHRVKNIPGPFFGRNEVVKLNTGQYKNIIFIHHSVGNNLIHQGQLRTLFQQQGYSFWDQDYISEGLTRPDGTPSGYSYNIPGDNTDIDGYAAIFQQRVYSQPVNAFSSLLQHEVILFKSCYPNSQIADDTILEQRKKEYIAIRQGIDQHPDHIFFLMTSPPLNPAETDPAAASRARALSRWLAASEFTAEHPNLFVFDHFDQLAESDPESPELNMLRKTFREGSDSHPNELANQMIAPRLVAFVAHGIEQYKIANQKSHLTQ